MPKLKISDIGVGVRFRKDFGDIESLATSISSKGLLHPIIVDANKHLIAGERRLQAHKMLGLEEIEVKYLKDIDDVTRKEIEIEENLRRKDFTWQEEILAKAMLDTIKRQQYGGAVKGQVGGWGLRETGEAVGQSTATISQDIALAKALDQFPELRKFKTKDAAFKELQKTRERAVRGEIAKRSRIKVDTSVIKNIDALAGLKELKSESVDLGLTDPPFGVNLDAAGKINITWSEVYDDDAYKVMEKIRLVLKEYYRVLKDNTHMYVFFGTQHYAQMLQMLIDAGFEVDPIPIIWNKSTGGSGVSPTCWVVAYESCFHCMKGRRSLYKATSDVLTYNRMPAQHKIHPCEKPRALLRRIIEASCDPGELVVDAYAGSASTILAALESNRNALGFEISQTHYDAACKAIADFSKEGV